MPSIEIENLHISFPLYHENARNLSKIANLFLSGRLNKDKNSRVYVQSLRDINVTVQPGECIGLIGHNGAGKTTLLRTIAGIYEPVSGHIKIQGIVRTLLDPSVGMNQELTGRENIQLYCLINNFTHKQTQDIEANVSEFSELGSYIDIPVKTYSSGMKMRLGFGLATSIAPQILLMDEWFLTGDASFIIKATHRIETIVKQAQILILSTHSPDIIKKWCNRVLWLEQGFIKMDGTPQDILPIYLNKPYDEII